MPRMRAGEPDPIDALHLVHRLEQAGEVTGGVVRRRVVVHNLPEQLHFPPAARGGLADFRDDVSLGPHALVPPRVGYDAEAAEVVAAFDDGHVRLHRIAPPRHPQRKRHIVVGIEIEQLSAAALAGLLHEHRQPANRLRADDDIRHARRSLEDGRAFLLRHAAGDRDNRVVAMLRRQLAKLAQPRVQLLLGALADAASVDHDHVGVGGLRGGFEAGLLQEPRHPLGVVEVHLAAERFDEVRTRHAHPSLSLFRFRLSTSIRLSPSGPRPVRPQAAGDWPASHAPRPAARR